MYLSSHTAAIYSITSKLGFSLFKSLQWTSAMTIVQHNPSVARTQYIRSLANLGSVFLSRWSEHLQWRSSNRNPSVARTQYIRSLANLGSVFLSRWSEHLQGRSSNINPSVARTSKKLRLISIFLRCKDSRVESVINCSTSLIYF